MPKCLPYLQKGYYGLVYIQVYIHACWLKIRLQINIPGTWKSKLKKKIGIENLKSWMVFEYYEKTSFSIILSFSVCHSECLSLCVSFCLTPSLWFQLHFYLFLLYLPCLPFFSSSILSSFVFLPPPKSCPWDNISFLWCLLLMLFACVFMYFSLVFLPG